MEVKRILCDVCLEAERNDPPHPHVSSEQDWVEVSLYNICPHCVYMANRLQILGLVECSIAEIIHWRED